MKRLLENDRVQSALAYIKNDDDRTWDELMEFCIIPAASHEEQLRAEYVRKKFLEIGLEDVHVDEVLNVFGTIRGTCGADEAGAPGAAETADPDGCRPYLMLAAHTDIVFPMSTPLEVKRDGDKFSCPGINDDSRSVTELFTIARAMKECGIRPTRDLVFCANVCEEGLGDLKGVKFIFAQEKKPYAFISIDNPVDGGIVWYGTGSRRYRVTVRGNGGHSFADFGFPSAIHGLGNIIARLSELEVPKSPKTTYNVGVISGGTSINTIAESASFLFDMRSDSQEELDRMEAFMRAAVAECVARENERAKARHGITEDRYMLKAEIEQVGDRPAGTQPVDSPIIKSAWEAAELVGLTPELRDESSTDANVPIAMGIPAVTIGRGGREGGVHTTSEWHIRCEDWRAPQRTLLFVLAMAGLDGVIEPRG